MVDKIVTAGGHQKETSDTTVRKLAGDLIRRRPQGKEMDETGSGEVEDETQLSILALQRIRGGEESLDFTAISSILTDILVENQGDGLPEADSIPDSPYVGRSRKTGGAVLRVEIEEIGVNWSPLMGDEEVVKKGRSWGRFRITRDRKEIEVQLGDGRNKTGKSATPGKGKPSRRDRVEDGQGKIVELPGRKGAGNPIAAPVGSSPGNLDENLKDQSPGGTLKLDNNRKVYVVDWGTGQWQEVPENGDLTATHPFKVAGFGKTGEVKPGDIMFWYNWPTPDELEKNR